MPRSAAAAVAALALAAALGACATLDVASVPRTPATAWQQPESTRLGRPLFADARSARAQSAFALLDTGVDALAARLALIDAAERTLDLQYYIVRGRTSLVVADRLIEAADRGVRVRLLVDDTTTFGAERGLSALDGHANVEVRAFNPFMLRRPKALAQAVELLVRGPQLNRRMHNKAFVADGAYAIVGGRNLGDEYFGAHEEIDFVDVDLLAGGPVARTVSESFDRYWNDELAVPLAALVPRAAATDRAEARAALADARRAFEAEPAGAAVAGNAMARRIREGVPPAEWASARVVADSPDKAEGPARAGAPDATEIAATLGDAIARVQHDLTIATAYFVPLDGGVAALAKARARGVAVRVLTNSLATTDVRLVHAAGYAKYRAPLLEAGIELYELRPQALPGGGGGGSGSGSGGGGSSASRATLHAKAIVLDRRDVVVGSFNLDPRSLALNTEIAIAVRSPALAAQLSQRIARALRPEHSYRLSLAPDGGGLRWTAGEVDRPLVWNDEPETTPSQRLWAKLMAIAPLEHQL